MQIKKLAIPGSIAASNQLQYGHDQPSSGSGQDPVAFDSRSGMPGGMPSPMQDKLGRPMPSAPNLAGLPQRGWQHFPQFRGRPDTALRGIDPSEESMRIAGELSSRYGPLGENLAVARRAAKGEYLRIGDVRPSVVQKALFLVSNINLAAMECIKCANERGEPVRALVFGAEMGADAFFMSKQLQSRADHGAEVTAVDIDTCATTLMEMTKEQETRRLQLEDVEEAGVPKSPTEARENLEWLAALESTQVFAGDADSALALIAPDKRIHLASASATFSYIANLEKTLSSLGNVMHEGGVLVFDVYGDTHQSLGKPLKLYNQQEIRDVLDSAGFDPIHVYENAPAGEAFHNIYVAVMKRRGS